MGGDFWVKVKVSFFIFRGSFEVWEIPYMYAKSHFKEYFFRVWAKKFFVKLLRPFVNFNGYFLTFLMF
jgi:hypothetical protein